MHILVVDYDSSRLASINDAWEMGHELISAAHGAQTGEFCRARESASSISPWMIPKTDGLEL